MTRLVRLLEAAEARGGAEALVYRGRSVSWTELGTLRRRWEDRLAEAGDEAGRVVGIKSDFSPDAVALMLALLSRGSIAALVPASAPRDETFLEEARASSLWRPDETGEWSRATANGTSDHELLDRLRETGGGGFILFSSGSSGKPKAILHDIERFLRKFDASGKAMRTLAFLLFDHVAGQDTLFYGLANGGCLVMPESRGPAYVARLIERHRVEVLPASPTFLKLFCLSGAAEERDLSCLKIVTYGSEAMPPETLARVGGAFPEARIVQKYGTSELGSPRSKSRDRGSLWISLKDDETEAKVIDGILWLRSDSAMLGYLNAPNPIDEEGWWCTGDLVEVDGDWIRILGRESEIINVGGEKVYPQEVEEVVLELDWVADAVVRGAAHPLTGQIVEVVLNLDPAIGEPQSGAPSAVRTASGSTPPPREERDVRKAVRAHCRQRLPGYKVPSKVIVTTDPLASDRQKKLRRSPASDAGA